MKKIILSLFCILLSNFSFSQNYNELILKFKTNNENNKVYVLMSDGELNEGTTWESLLFANHHKLDNINIIWNIIFCVFTFLIEFFKFIIIRNLTYFTIINFMVYQMCSNTIKFIFIINSIISTTKTSIFGRTWMKIYT